MFFQSSAEMQKLNETNEEFTMPVVNISRCFEGREIVRKKLRCLKTVYRINKQKTQVLIRSMFMHFKDVKNGKIGQFR